jgi:hypothetical protein
MAGMAMTTTSGSMASSTAMSSMDMNMDIGTCKVSVRLPTQMRKDEHLFPSVANIDR